MSRNQALPLVSCLCVTRKKTDKLRRAINCFSAQSYPNKELVIVFEGDDDETRNFIAKEYSKQDDIFCIEVGSTPKLTLGELRNVSIASCHGEYFCQWDDDDWYHIDRIKIQMDVVLNRFFHGTMVTNWIIFDQTTGNAYFSMYRLWEGSVLCKKDLVNGVVRYPALSQKEDTVFTELLLQNTRIYPLAFPLIYIYVYHGANTWSKEHFDDMFSKSQKLSHAVATIIREILCDQYSMQEASVLLNSRTIVEEIDYFSFYKNESRQTDQG